MMRVIHEMTDEELNHAITVELMGWHVINVGKGVSATVRDGVENMNDPRWLECPPKYVEDITAAWQVVEKLMEDNFMVSIGVSHESSCWCDVQLSNGRTVEAEYCRTAPRAICEAALTAARGDSTDEQ